jgi:hypothetical protein
MEARQLAGEKPFHTVLEKMELLISNLQSQTTQAKNLGDLEVYIEEEQREISRCLLEESIRNRGNGDAGKSVAGSDGINRTHKKLREITIQTIFGSVPYVRIGYGSTGATSLFPLDGRLNTPSDSYSHGLRRLLGNEVVKTSFENALESIEDRTGVLIPKRQAEEISKKIAVDFDLFYERRLSDPTILKVMDKCPILVLSTDGKGIVMIHDDLKEATKKRAEKSESKLKKRLSRGEKTNCKRMAQVASVYAIDKNERTPEQVAGVEEKSNEPQPKPVGKRVWASVEKDQEVVIHNLFDEAETRDPYYEKEWVILVDGQPRQLEKINAELGKRKIKATIIVDIVHVIEYLWKAARCLFEETAKEAESWVTEHLLEILNGKAKTVAAGIRRSATFKKLKTKARQPIDTCCNYLHKLSSYMDYNNYLKKGYPIATGVIEGACRYLVKDRLEITGARWSLKGAEAILRLRSLFASGDLEEYWVFHREQEFERNHESKYLNPVLLGKKGLKLIK